LSEKEELSIFADSPSKNAGEPIESRLDEEHGFGLFGNLRRLRIHIRSVDYDSVPDEVAADEALQGLLFDAGRLREPNLVAFDSPFVPARLPRETAVDVPNTVTRAEGPTLEPRQNRGFSGLSE
jgi:hypothetical protein